MANNRRSLAERKERILECAVELFARRGFRRATTREIARMAGVKEPILFRAFGNKHRLIGEAIDASARRIEAAVDGMVRSSSFSYLIDNYYDIYARRENEHLVLYHAAAECAGERDRNRLRSVYIRIADRIARMLPRSAAGTERRRAIAWLLISIGHFYIVRRRCAITEADVIRQVLREMIR